MKFRFQLLISFVIMLFFVREITAQWIWQNPLPQGNTLNDVKVFNDGSAIAVGYNGIVLKTKDNGNTWITDSLGYNNNLNSIGVYFYKIQENNFIRLKKMV